MRFRAILGHNFERLKQQINKTMKFTKEYDNNYQRNVYTLKGKHITLTISKDRVYKKDKWASVGDWRITYYNNQNTHELDGRAVYGEYKTLSKSKEMAILYMKDHDNV